MTPRERNQIHGKILTFKLRTFWIPFRCSFQALSHWNHSKGAAHKLPIPVAALWPQPNSNILSTAITQILVPKTCDEVERGCRVHNLCQLQGHGSAHDILTSADIYFFLHYHFCHVWIQPLWGARQGHGFTHDILTSEDVYFLYHHCVPYVDKPSAKSKLPASN